VKKQFVSLDLEVLFLTEPLLSRERHVELVRVFRGYDVFVRQRKQKEKSKRYQQRGGIVCIAKKGRVVLDKQSESDDVMWVTWRGIRVVCVYFSPPSSPFEKGNGKRMEEVQQKILERFSEEVILLTDANGWIGNKPSTISQEVGSGRQTTTYTRTSVRSETNRQGEWFLTSMDNVNMIVLNGIRSQAQYTYDHPGREARSVVDFVAVNEKLYNSVSDITYRL
jgi:hypothetical protein